MNLPIRACCLISVLIENPFTAGGADLLCNPLDLTLDVSRGWRHAADPAAGAFALRFGVAPDALHLAIRIRGGDTSRFTTHVLNRGAAYHFRLDALNGNGVTPGTLSGLKP